MLLLLRKQDQKISDEPEVKRYLQLGLPLLFPAHPYMHILHHNSQITEIGLYKIAALAAELLADVLVDSNCTHWKLPLILLHR